MTRDELRGIAEDVLAIASLSDSQTAAALLSRVNGASLKDMLVAVLSVAREQTREIAGLEYALRDSEQSRDRLERDIERIDKITSAMADEVSRAIRLAELRMQLESGDEP